MKQNRKLKTHMNENMSIDASTQIVAYMI